MNALGVKGKWIQLFEKEYIKSRIYEIAEKFPEVTGLQLSMQELESVDLFDPISESPEEVLRLGKDILAQCIDDLPLPDIPEINALQLSIRPTGGAVNLNIREIRHWHRRKLIEFEGIVRRCTKIDAAIVRATYLCKRCGHKFYQNTEETKPHVDLVCTNQNCGRRGPFDLVEEECIFTDNQWITIQEPFDNLDDGKKEPKNLNIQIKGDITDKTQPGDRVRVVGIIEYVQKSEKGRKGEYEPYLDGLYLDTLGADYKNIVISQKEEQHIIQESRDPEIIEKLIQSTAPSIIGYSEVKLGLLMQQVSGCVSRMSDETTSRGEIHILLVGDPSIGKSIMLSFIRKLTPRYAMGAGGGASGIGITAGVLKDEQYGWVVEAGVIPLANGGTAIVDEFDKLKEDDRAKLHEALEQGEIHIDKASIHAVLPTRCSLIAAANPKLGRFDKYEPLGTQVNLSPALISRFDLIFVMVDDPDPERDKQIAHHMLSGAKDTKPPMDLDFLRKYLAYARSIYPKISEACESKLIAYYTTTRKNRSFEKCIPILPRGLHSLRRLAEASAKLRLSEEVTEYDADLAIKLYKAAFDPLLSAEDGKWDADKIDLGISSLDRDRSRQIKQVILDLSLGNEGATLQRILSKARELSIPDQDAMEIISSLKEFGDIIEHTSGSFMPAN